MEAIFSNPKFAAKGAFEREAKKKGFTAKQIKDFLDTNEANQINKQKIGKIDYYPIYRDPYSYQGDLVFIEGTPVLNLIDCNSRFSYATVLKNKEGATVAKALEPIVKESHMQYLQTDNGKEFLNKQVKDVLEKYGVIFNTVEPGNHRGQGMIERMNQTLRNLITQWATRGGDWKKDLQDLVFSYNHRTNRAIHMDPADATEETGLYDRYLQQGRARAKDTFKIGDLVRKLIQKNTFEKGRHKYSQETFTIVGRSGNGWDLSDGSHKLYYELQFIKGVAEPIPLNREKEAEVAKKTATVTRRTRKEGLESIVKSGAKDIVAVPVVRKAKEKIVFDASLVGRYVLRKGVRGKVVKYDKEGPYHYRIDFPDRDENFTNAEMKLYLV